MNRINLLFTLTSINVLLVTIERFSFTTKILLQPYSFLRLHEVFQITVLILITVIIPWFLLKETTHNFETLKTKKGMYLGLLFIVGLYFYSTGNGLHEVASFLFNTFCDKKNAATLVCKSMFFNDYYTGNTYYFIGALFSNISLMLLELQKPQKPFSSKEMNLLYANSFVFAFAIFAYSAFDKVLVGLTFSAVTAGIASYLLFSSKKKRNTLPFTVYTTTAYVLGAIISLLVRFY